MTNLSKRVEKAKKLIFTYTGHNNSCFGTTGSHNDAYTVTLSHTKEVVPTPDGAVKMWVFLTDCQKNEVNKRIVKKWQWTWQDGERVYKAMPAEGYSTECTCKGNERHTVCYHSLGAIYNSFKTAETPRLVSFYEKYCDAVHASKSFGGWIAKVKSANGGGSVWCVIKDWPKKVEILSVEENRQLMRGDEEDEGID